MRTMIPDLAATCYELQLDRVVSIEERVDQTLKYLLEQMLVIQFLIRGLK